MKTRWAILIWPDWYDDADDTGYYWAGEAESEADAVAQACLDCDADNDHVDAQGEYLHGWTPTDPKTVKVIEAGPDWRGLCHMVWNDLKSPDTHLPSATVSALRAAIQ